MTDVDFINKEQNLKKFIEYAEEKYTPLNSKIPISIPLIKLIDKSISDISNLVTGDVITTKTDVITVDENGFLTYAGFAGKSITTIKQYFRGDFDGDNIIGRSSTTLQSDGVLNVGEYLAGNEIYIIELGNTFLDSEAKEFRDAAKTYSINAQNSATAANINASNAQTSETNATSSATSALQSKVNAEESETNAKASETNSKASENNAAASSIAASNAASNASNSATSAVNSANSANAAATTATDAVNSIGDAEANSAASASAALASENNAATSENNAVSSASNASTSESNAATSASNAANSASSATASASSSATSETNAANSATAAAASAASIANGLKAFGAANSGSNAGIFYGSNIASPLTGQTSAGAIGNFSSTYAFTNAASQNSAIRIEAFINAGFGLLSYLGFVVDANNYITVEIGSSLITVKETVSSVTTTVFSQNLSSWQYEQRRMVISYGKTGSQLTIMLEGYEAYKANKTLGVNNLTRVGFGEGINWEIQGYSVQGTAITSMP